MSVPIKMKITKEKLQQIIKEEYQRALSEIDPERHGMGRTYSAYEIPDDFEDDDELSFEDRNRFVKAYNMIADAVETGQLPESVEDAVFDMLGKLGINL
jgi:hypothetical protein